MLIYSIVVAFFFSSFSLFFFFFLLFAPCCLLKCVLLSDQNLMIWLKSVVVFVITTRKQRFTQNPIFTNVCQNWKCDKVIMWELIRNLQLRNINSHTIMAHLYRILFQWESLWDHLCFAYSPPQESRWYIYIGFKIKIFYLGC